MPVLETVENVQEQLLETIETVQTRFINTNKKIATQVTDRVGDRLPEMPSLPILGNVANRIPKPSVAVSSYFDLVERATKANRKFALDLVGAWAPSSDSAADDSVADATDDVVEAVADKAAAVKNVAKKTVAKAVSTSTED